MKDFIFDLQRFATTEIKANQPAVIDGVTFTALEDAVLNLDSEEKVSGIASGKVVATLEDNPAVQITFDGTESFDFSCSAEDDALAVAIQNRSIKFTSGTISCSAESFSATGKISVTGSIKNILPFNIDIDIPDEGMNIILGNETKIIAPAAVDATLTFPENVAEIVSAFKPLIAPLLNVDEDTANKIFDVVYKLVSSPTTAQIEGTLSWNQDEKKLIINQDSNLALNILDYNLSMTAQDGNVDGMSFFSQFTQEDAAFGAKFTPSTDAKAELDLKLYKSGSQICDGLLNITAGSIAIDILNGKTSVEKDTCVTFTQGDDTFQFKFDAAATLTYAADEKGISQFTFGNNDGKVDLTLYRDDKEILTANVEINGTITVDTENHSIGMTKDTTSTIKINDSTYTLTATDDAGATVTFQDDKFILTPNDGSGGIIIAITKDDATVFSGTLNVTGGTVTFDPIEQKFSFAKGTNISFAVGDGSQEINFEVKGSDASFKIEPDSDGSFTITPDTEDGSVDVTLKQNGKTVFENNLSVNGSMTFNPATQLLTLKDGTTVFVTFNNYTLTATADGNASSTISLTADGILITPNTEDKGKLKLTLTGTSSGSLSADIEILSGGILFGLDGTLTVTKNTELQIKFSDDYIINFKTTADAGGILSLGTDGITFKPNSDEEDGGLELTVKRGKDTRTASLDVTGSVTYKLDGSISLTKGTVVKNVFEDGNILTITANTDASGTINFNPQTGLTINPETADALTVSLQTGDLEVVKITSIDGSINYSGGIVTASNGTKARISYYFGWKSDLYTKGGSASIQFTDDRTIYTANTGATFTVDYLDNTTTEIQNGSYADVYGETIEDYVELVSEGTTLKSNDAEVVFTLEKAGNYTLNGMDFTTTKDNVEVRLPDYDTVTFAADDDIKVSTVDGGKLFMVDEINNTIQVSTKNFNYSEVTNGSLTFDNATKNFSIDAGTTYTFTQNEQVIKFTAPEKISTTYKVEDKIQYLMLDDITTLNLSVTSGGQKVFNGKAEMGGVVSYNPETGTFGLTGANSSHGDGTNTFLQLTNDEGYTLKIATKDTTVAFVPKFTDGKFEIDFPNERKNEMLLTLGKDGQTTFEGKVTLSGTVDFDISNPVGAMVEILLKRTELGYPVAAGLFLNPEEIIGDEPTNYSVKEDWNITSEDNLKLHGVSYTPENSTDKWVVLVHGYGLNHKSMYPFATAYLANDYNVLLIDQRAAGESEGEYLTMGAAESQDVALWTQEIARRNSNAKITLHGVSMGSATAMLAASRADAVNVTSLIEDCGYSSAMKLFNVINDNYLGLPTLAVAALDPISKVKTGYYLHDASPIDSISSAKMPTLFISGDDDAVVPVSMLSDLYDASGAEVKEKFIVPGAGHAQAGLNDLVGYANSVFRFVSEANGEGWDTENSVDNISLRGTKYNDTLTNSGDAATVNGEDGDDFISNFADDVSIFGGEGNDTIYNHGDFITIDGGEGDDSISNNSAGVVFVWSGGNDTIDGFKEDSVFSIGSDFSTQVSGDDVIVTVGENKIVLTGASNLDNLDIVGAAGVTLENTASNSLVSGTDDNDSITNYGSNSTIQALAGMDTIFNMSDYSVIDGGDGSDSISNYSPQGVLLADNVSVSAGKGNDTIRNEHAYNVTLDGGSGNDKIIVVTGDHTTIKGGAGNDTILGETLEGNNSTWAMGGYANIDGGSGDDYIDPIFSDSASIFGGAGNDTIINEGDDSTLNGGAGDDVISLHGASLENNVIQYAPGDGNDSVFGFNETSKLSLSGGTEFSTQISGDDVIVSVGSNEITIAGGANLSTVNITDEETKALNISNTTNSTLLTGTELADTIQNSGANVSVKSLAGNDSITSNGANSSINAGAGDDTITNSGKNSTILGEYGHDSISNTADDVSISGGYGNDSITNSGSNVTISGGSGYNYTSNTGDNVLINFGGGLDTIAGFSENSTLSVSSADYETLEGLRNILVSSGDDIAVLQNAFLLDDSINVNGTTHEVEGKEIHLVDGGDEVLIGRSNVSIVSGTGDDKISLKSGATNDVIQYAEGDGNDTIWGFNETSKLSISGEYSSIKVGDDVLVTVGSDSIKVVGGSSVMSTAFEDGETILLTKKGIITRGDRIFELTKNVPPGVTLTGMKNGFTTAITEDDGKIFIDEFIADDDSYTAKIDSTGLQTVSGIDAGTNITTGATLDGEEEENQIYIVTEDAGSYTFNDMTFTAGTANAVIRLRPQAMAFDSSDEIVYDGKIFTGNGFVTVSSDIVAMGAGVVADGFEDGESFILMQQGSVTVDGKTFELNENISEGMTIESADGGYTLSHEITQKEVTKNNLPSDYLGKIYSENVVVENDGTYSLQANSFGLKKVSGISNGATINGGDTSIDGDYDDKYAQGGQYFYVDTDTEGTFTIGEKTYNISGDSNVEIEAMILPEKSYASGFASLDGTVSGSFAGDSFYVNGNKKPILVEGDDDFYVVGGSSGTKLYDISDGATLASLGGVREVHTDTEGVFWLAAEPVPFGVTVTGDDNVTFGFNAAGDLMSADNLEGSIRFSKGTGGELSINGIGIHIKNTAFSSIGAYDDSLYIHDIERGTISAGEKVWLEMTGETMTLNGNELTLTGDADGIWIRDKEIVGLDENASLKVSTGGIYTAGTTTLKAKSGDVIIGLENNDAYIYDANNPLVTKNTSTADLEKIFQPQTTKEISSGADVTVDGGNLVVVENISEAVNITAGDDTIVSRGQNVHVNLTPETNTWLFPLEGKMTLEGCDETTGTGFGTTFTDIPSAVEDGRIDFDNGTLALGSAQVDVGSNSALMNFYNRAGQQQKVGFASQGDSLDASGKTEDLLLVAKENSTITGGSGNDTILAAEGSFVDGGTGKNLVRSDDATVAVNGRTTVEGEVDTIYIANADPGVDFRADGLTFYDNNARKYLTLSDVHSTKKMNLYYASSGITGSHVFIADDEWYNVSDGTAQYYVGATATKNHGIDFSGVSEALDVTLNTDYAADTTFWINNIHSIKGGSASTKITGSDKNDTILAGTGETTIDAGAGHDKMFGNTSANKNSATFIYTAGDGRDSIENFNFTSNAQDVTADKVKLDDSTAVNEILLRGSDVMIKVDGADGFLMLEDAKGKSFRLNDDLIAKVDTNVSFDGFTNSYVGIGTKATLTVGKGLGNIEVWLSDDSLEYHGTRYDGNFAVLDASQSDGSNILAGNELNNSIVGGFGSDSLWGGYTSSDDTLVGGAGQNTFFYGSGNGRDKIQNAHDGDLVSLEDITLDQIAEANITAAGVVLNFTDGGSLTIDGTADVTYQLADGSKHSANHSTLEWEAK